jgi:hypothetical protein
MSYPIVPSFFVALLIAELAAPDAIDAIIGAKAANHPIFSS